MEDDEQKVEEPQADTPAEADAPEAPDLPDEEELAALDAAADRLRELQVEKAEDRSPRRLLGMMAVVALIFVALIYNLPAWLVGETVDERLMRRSLAYCKYDGPPGCEEHIRRRADVCFKRDLDAHYDVFGRCMTEEFPDYYERISLNLPKGLD